MRLVSRRIEHSIPKIGAFAWIVLGQHTDISKAALAYRGHKFIETITNVPAYVHVYRFRSADRSIRRIKFEVAHKYVP